MDNNRPLNDELFKNMKDASSYINKIYDKTSFADNYGSSIIIVVVLTIFVLSVFSYCLAMQKKEEIYADWNNNRCKPQYIPIAGFIAAPEGQSIGDYTSENFQYCVQSQATSLAGYALQPFVYMLSALSTIVSFLSNMINAIREMFNKFRNNVAEFVKVVMGKLLNIVSPIITMFIALLDSLQKTQGVMATGVFTLLSVYYALQSLIGSIFEIMGKFLIVMIAIVVFLWILPFTWPVAAGMSLVYIVLAILTSVLMYAYAITFGIKLIKIPKLRCFDKNVQFNMNNGITKNICDIEVGDVLEDGTKVTSKMKLDASNLRMFNIRGIVVSESHIIKHGDKWLPIKYHPEAVEIFNYSEPYLYCLNTDSKQILLNGLTFTDWDEIYDNTLTHILNTIPFENDYKERCANIHRYLDVGFNKDTNIDLKGNTNKKIKDIEIGDTLLSGAKVYGIVEIETNELFKYKLSLGNNAMESKLYHLLTDDKIFSSNGQIIPDYNDHIDNLLNNKKII